MNNLALLLLAPLVLADVGLQRDGVTVGPVRDLDCVKDGGFVCFRDGGTSVGKLFCASATATTPGCVTTLAQTYAGTKTFTGDLRVVGHTHASLTACSNGVKGMWQTCTTHNAPVFCDGTTNYELIGSTAAEQVLWPIYVNGIPTATMGGITISSTSGWTITAVSGFWNEGTGAGSLPILFVSSAGTCTCNVDCDAPLARSTCTGNCTIAASDTILAGRGTTGCTLDPAAGGNVDAMGTMP